MKALSIQQPWAYLITHGLKDIENRDWTTDYRGFILIHAGKQKDRSCFLYDHGGTGATLDPRIPWTNDDRIPQWDYQYKYGGIVGYATLQKVVTQSESPWFCGRYGFVLTQRQTVEFIPLRGQLKLFDVPASIEAQINEIREERFHEAESREQAQIAKEWREYRLEGDETPSWK